MKNVLKSCILGVAVLVSAASTAHAAYPDKPIRLVVPYPPGSGTDTVARYMALQLEKKLSQTIVVENKTGGNAIIATESVIRSSPDGYTLLWAANGPVTTNAALYKKLSYDPLKDLKPVARIAYSPMGLYVPSSSPYQSVTELFDAGKKEPKSLNYGSGSATYNIATEWLLSLAGVQANAINYRGSAPTVSDVAAGRTDFTTVEYSAALPMVQAGKVRLLAMTSDKRFPAEPDTPTLQELGYKDFFQVAWWGIFAPSNTPDNIVSKLQETSLEIVKEKETAEWLKNNNFSEFPGDADELRKFQESEINRESSLVKKFGIPQL
ncbi:ABC transporter substrate-binding protein [Advenella sp. S44]|uniref:Bug family tripartite tricarboxylate transporter substrate binding protein n=1 Tax=Advenella sp. S44 TaxID=1982755 RepID=UPI000C2965F7|nr:tripartite tricarboxylate transporter substrate binding protein [Advenella sp. S44]PJX27960.1 ABC transporter substrate-binding protein [Advenella sp. S44]